MELLLSVANVSLMKKKLTKGRINKHRKWFNSDLHKMRKTFDHKEKIMAKYPSDPLVRGRASLNTEKNIANHVNCKAGSIKLI